MKSLVASHPEMAEELPLVHTSRCERFLEIAATSSLEPHACDLFNESLTYLFYGRPAYRGGRNASPGEGLPLCPVCFVFKPRTVSRAVHRVYPCDSGAVATDRFAPHVTASDLYGLALEPQIESARRAVSLLFEHNASYFVGKAVTGKTFPVDSLEARFYSLLVQSGPVDYDDRKSAIEVQVSRTIQLTDQLLFVVLPREFLEEAGIRNVILNVWNCDPVPYPTFSGDTPSAYYSIVRDRVTQRFRDATRI